MSCRQRCWQTGACISLCSEQLRISFTLLSQQLCFFYLCKALITLSVLAEDTCAADKCLKGWGELNLCLRATCCQEILLSIPRAEALFHETVNRFNCFHETEEQFNSKVFVKAHKRTFTAGVNTHTSHPNIRKPIKQREQKVSNSNWAMGATRGNLWECFTARSVSLTHLSLQHGPWGRFASSGGDIHIKWRGFFLSAIFRKVWF